MQVDGGDLAAGEQGPEDMPQLVRRLHREPGAEECRDDEDTLRGILREIP